MGQVCVHLGITNGVTIAELWEFIAWFGQPRDDAVDLVERDTSGRIIGLRVCFAASEAGKGRAPMSEPDPPLSQTG